MKLTPYFLLVLLGCLAQTVQAQRMLLLEKTNSAKTHKIYEGSLLRYQVVDDKTWYEGEIMELREDIQAIIFPDRIVSLDKITRLRSRRRWPYIVGLPLITFGTSWSGYALIGYAVDGDPETKYGRGDAIVTAVSVGAGLLAITAFGNRKIRVGAEQKRRLRVVDVSF
ncbi:MAG: hypothetical protein AAGJ82_04905 [Bacteroidota bacterium]